MLRFDDGGRSLVPTTFDWATDRWNDSWTGAEVVRLVPEEGLHVHINYFRSTAFTRDGTKLALRGDDPDGRRPSCIWVIDLQGRLRSRGTHEHWSADGTRVYSHGWPFACHAIYVNDLQRERPTRYIGRPGIGDSIHMTPAPDESFMTGDGRSFSIVDVGLIESLGQDASPTSTHPWDGLQRNRSATEVI